MRRHSTNPAAIEAEIAHLRSLVLDAFRRHWRVIFGRNPPADLSKDLLGRMIAYRLQERAFGGLDRESLRFLDGQMTAARVTDGAICLSSSRKGPKKKPRQTKGGTSIWVRGGRLAFSLHKAIPPSFTLHKAKVPCPPRARKWPRCRRGQFLPDTQIYWSAEGAAFSFRYQNNSVLGESFRRFHHPHPSCRGSHLCCGRFELRNVEANYPFERLHRFAGIQPNSGFGDTVVPGHVPEKCSEEDDTEHGRPEKPCCRRRPRIP
jgi:hypothetical protein